MQTPENEKPTDTQTSIDVAMDELNAAVTPDAEEETHSPLHAGIRGQIKKIMRSFTHLHGQQLAENQRKELVWRNNLLSQMNASLGKLDKRFSGMYGTLINHFLLKQEIKVQNVEVAMKALIEESAERLYAMESALRGAANAEAAVDEASKISQELAPFVTPMPEASVYLKEFNDAVFKRMELIATELKNKAESAELANQEAAKAKAEEVLTPQEPAPDATAPTPEAAPAST